MIKNLLTAAAIALLTAGSAFAQQTVFIGTQGYDNLGAAYGAATDGQTITVNANQEISARIDFSTEKVVTIEGKEGVNVSLVWTNGYKNGMIRINGNATVNFKNLTFDGNNGAEMNNKPIEISSAAKSVSFDNCKIVNFNADRAIHVAKATTITNLTESNCTFTNGTVYVGANNSLTVDGNANEYSIRYDRLGWPITGTANVGGNITLSIPTFEANAVVVKNCTNADAFSLKNAPEGYVIAANGNNLVLSFEKMVVTNETQNTQYSSLLAALDAAKSDDVLIVNEDIEMGDRFIIKGKNLTVKGANQSVVIKRTDPDKNHLMFETDNSTLTIEDIVIDCNNVEINKNVFNNKKALVLKNVVIKNAVGSAALIGGGTATLENVTGENNAENLMVSVNSLSLNGNNNLPVNLASGATITVPEGGVLTNEQPIELTLASIPDPLEENTVVVVKNCTNRKKFSLTNDGAYYLVVGEGDNANNLVLSAQKPSGIEDVVVDENAPVEYYNLSGMRVNGDNMAPGVYIKRQGAKATKVYVK